MVDIKMQHPQHLVKLNEFISLTPLNSQVQMTLFIGKVFVVGRLQRVLYLNYYNQNKALKSKKSTPMFH